MHNVTYGLLLILLGGLCACQPDQEPAYHPAAWRRTPAASAAAPQRTTEAEAHRLGQHLRQQLQLTPAQARQLSQLTLAQAHEEQTMWARLADTTRQQLRTIAQRYDSQVQGVLTPSQYQQFARLRQLSRHRQHARAAEARRQQ